MDNIMVAHEQKMLTNEQIIAHLNTLIETCKDGQQGFTAAAEDVQNSAFETLFSTYARQRGRFIKELEAEIRHLGGDPEKASGTLTGILHRGWIDMKSAWTNGDEATILSECVRGETSAVEVYKTMLAENDLTTDINQLVKSQYMDICMAYEKVRSLTTILAD